MLKMHCVLVIGVAGQYVIKNGSGLLQSQASRSPKGQCRQHALADPPLKAGICSCRLQMGIQAVSGKAGHIWFLAVCIVMRACNCLCVVYVFVFAYTF